MKKYIIHRIPFLAFLFILILGCSRAPVEPEEPKTTITIADQSFILAENSQNGSEVGTIEATINKQNASLSYQIIAGNTDNAFSLDRQSGLLTVANSEALDFETTPVFSLEMEASTQDTSSTAVLTINLVDLTDDGNPPVVTACQLEKIFTNDFVDLGFPNNGPAPSLGVVNVHVLFADFPDVPASGTTNDIYDLLDPINNNYFDEMSYGRMEVNFIPYQSWIRLSQPSAHYGWGLRSGVDHLAFIQEAVDSADSQVDFSNADIVLVMSNPEAVAIPIGPAFGSLNDFFSIKADGNSIRTGITSGYDLNNWGGIWLAHEMGHSLGLSDLYAFSGNSINQYVGNFSIMGFIAGTAPGFFAYERWLLGWLDDDQLYCHSSGEVTLELQQLETSGGLKAVMVPLSDNKSLVIESRRKVGFDANLTKEGVLVYVVDTSKERGTGPIVVKPGVLTGPEKEDALMVVGDTYFYQGVRVEVLDAKETIDIVKISL